MRTDWYGDALPPGAIARLGSLRLRHNGAVHAVAFSTDGKILASEVVTDVVRLWDVKTGKEIRCLHGHEHCVTGVAFAPHGKTLASADRQGIVFLWDVASGKELGKCDKGQNGMGETLCWLLPPTAGCLPW